MVISKVFKHLERGVSITSAGTGFVRFILLHNPETTCPRIKRLVPGIFGREIYYFVPENYQSLNEISFLISIYIYQLELKSFIVAGKPFDVAIFSSFRRIYAHELLLST